MMNNPRTPYEEPRQQWQTPVAAVMTIEETVASCHRLLLEFKEGLRHMSNRVDDLIASITADAAAISARFDALLAAISANANNTITDTQIASLQAESDALKALGSTTPVVTPAVTPHT